MSNTMIAGATKIWYYVPLHKCGAFETWLNATRPGYIENLEAGVVQAYCTASPVVAACHDMSYMRTWVYTWQNLLLEC